MNENFDLTHRLAKEYAQREKEQDRSSPIEFLSLARLPKEPPPLVLDGLLRVGQVLLMGGHSKKWKSYALRDLFFCVANGFNWLGHRTFPGLVVDIDLECEKWDLRRRYEEIRDSYGTGNLDNIKIASLRGKVLSISDLAQLPEQLKTFGASLAGIEPVYRLLAGKSESDAGAITDMMNRFLTIATETLAALATSHHFSKGGQADKEAIDRFSGSGVWGRHPDALITFTQHAEEDCFTVDITLRSFPSRPPFVVQWQYPRFHLKQDADPENLKRPVGRPKKSGVEEVCSLMPAKETVSPDDLYRRAHTILGMSKRTFDRRINEGKTQGWIYRTPTDEYGLTTHYINGH
jgi:AAA domain